MALNFGNKCEYQNNNDNGPLKIIEVAFILSFNKVNKSYLIILYNPNYYSKRALRATVKWNVVPIFSSLSR